MSRVPRIRFKGFEEDWEQRKLEYYLEVSEERNLSNDYTKENVLSVSGDVGIVNQIEFQGRSFAGILVNNYGVVKTGYVVYTKSPLKNNPYGIIKANRGRDGIVSTLYAIYKPKLNVNSNFIQIYFEQNARMNNYMQPLVNKGAKNDMKISSGNALKGNVVFPIRKEQDIIVDFFFKIDYLITLHQRKFEKLKIIKKSILENLFPQNGEKTPKIRFSGFTKDWEQRKLGEVFEEYSEKNRSELPPLTIIQGGGTIRRDESDRALQYDKGSLSNYKVVNKGDFIVHLRSFEGGLEKANSTGIVSPAYHTLSGENTDTIFYYAYFRSKKFIESDLKPHVYGIRDGRSIDIEGMKTINIPYTTFDEQRRIGKFIDLIDHLITLHQSKLEKLQKIKKSMLESMFV